ncbi:hypothetical protein HanIR_Chr06g0265251 [Helianthus annuus]|nr:hypothetical protein HanIR_Chr06g0265251 [Helianthus annuus]
MCLLIMTRFLYRALNVQRTCKSVYRIINMIVSSYKKINLASGYFNQKIFCAMCIQINFQSFSKMSQLSVFTSVN